MKSLFSTAQQAYCDYLIPTMYGKGYKYYVAYTNVNTGGYYSNEPDLYFVFSEKEITASSAYSFTAQAGSVMYIVRTGNYSSGNQAVNTDRLTSKAFSGSFRVDSYEHIYSNAEFAGTTVQPDILQNEVKQDAYMQGQGIILTAFFLFIVFWKMCTFRK